MKSESTDSDINTTTATTKRERVRTDEEVIYCYCNTLSESNPLFHLLEVIPLKGGGKFLDKVERGLGPGEFYHLPFTMVMRGTISTWITGEYLNTHVRLLTG